MDDFEHLKVDRKLLDRIGPWTIKKHEIVTYYAQIYSNILSATKAKRPFSHIYIDGFAGSGLAINDETNRIVKGSALHVRDIKPPFDRYVLVELDPKRSEILSQLCQGYPTVRVIPGDANIVLPEQVFPTIRFERGERALCFLDPYKLGPLRWETILAASRTKAIDVLIHFPVMDINRSVLRKNGTIKPDGAVRLTGYWGDDSWKDHASTTAGLLALSGVKNKATNEDLVQAFCRRLREVAGFEFVEGSILLQNTKKSTIYYLIIASHNIVAARVMGDTSRRFGPQRAPKRKTSEAPPQLDLGM